MVRISAIFIALCMVLIAGSLGFVVYLRFGLTGAESALVALGVLTALAVYNTVAARSRDRQEVSNQIANVSRGSGDLARQVAAFERALTGLEIKIDTVLDRALGAAQPLAVEIEELSTLVKQLAESVAAHEVALSRDRSAVRRAPAGEAPRSPVPTAATVPVTLAAPVVPVAPPAAMPGVPVVAPIHSAAALPEPDLSPPVPLSDVPVFKGLDRNGIIAKIASAIAASAIDLYLQPIVTLPQRKVRYYEALSRLKAEHGEIVSAGDFLEFAEAGSLMPKLDNLSLLRCVQIVRRLLLKNRDVGVFCNVSAATLTDTGFPQLLEFMDANRAIAPALTLEFTQSAVRAMGPIEHESLAALAERGFRFSMDNLVDLRLEPRELNERGFRFIKVPAALLLNRIGAAAIDIHPADFSDLLGRFGIDLIAERIERESTVVDLLDYDVRFGQGFLFSQPRPVRAEALQALAADTVKSTEATKSADANKSASLNADAVAPARSAGLAALARAGGGRT